MFSRLIERLTTFPFNPLSDATPPSHPSHRDNNTWPKWRKAMRRWGQPFESRIPPRSMTLTPQENFERTEQLLCPVHFGSVALLPGSVCPFDGWPEAPLKDS